MKSVCRSTQFEGQQSFFKKASRSVLLCHSCLWGVQMVQGVTSNFHHFLDLPVTMASLIQLSLLTILCLSVLMSVSQASSCMVCASCVGAYDPCKCSEFTCMKKRSAESVPNWLLRSMKPVAQRPANLIRSIASHE
ncbi:hypothetical protein Btru_077158 [Bulinus truncatus]|nr:hypothetical protein Btru_077158 [Bulinus truncatus]